MLNDGEFDDIKEIGIDLDDSYFKADHYLPRDFDENIWNYALGNYDKSRVPQLTENDE